MYQWYYHDQRREIKASQDPHVKGQFTAPRPSSSSITACIVIFIVKAGVYQVCDQTCFPCLQIACESIVRDDWASEMDFLLRAFDVLFNYKLTHAVFMGSQ